MHKCFKILSISTPPKTSELTSMYFIKLPNILHGQKDCLRALDYNITDLLHESRQRLKGIIIDLYGEENELECNLLVKILRIRMQL